MQKHELGTLFSASDLVNYAACEHLTHLDLVNLDAPLPKADDTEEMTLIQGKGYEHEARYVETLRREHGNVLDLSAEGGPDEDSAHVTVAALKGGEPVLFQATFLSHPWVGHADFLVRVDTPSVLGDYSYEVVDTKLARSSRAKFLIQLCLYSELLAEVQGVMPARTHVVLGSGLKESFRVAEYVRYFRQLKSRFLAWTSTASRPTYPERSEHCAMCRWRELCQDQWERDDHLNRVAGISRQQIPRLIEAAIPTLSALATVGAEVRVPGMQPETLQRLAHQARLQVESTRRAEPLCDVLPLRAGKGFGRMPRPAEGDLFFDMEGNPLEAGGLEYLFGAFWIEEGEEVFKAIWSHNREEERAAFEAFMDFVTAHLARWPCAHVYHYAAYERSALQRLMSLHGTREEQVDDLLRHHKLVDLYAVVREGLRVGESSYSIKAIERFYRTSRTGDVRTASGSIVFYERWKATANSDLLKAIEDYNHDDVRSTYELREWLLRIRPTDATWAFGAHDSGKPLRTKTRAAAEAEAELESSRSRLLGPVPADSADWAPEDFLRELLFHLLSFHRRCDKPVWWGHFERQLALEEDLIEDIEVLAGLRQSHPPEREGGQYRYWYSFPDQETKITTGDHATVTSLLKEVSELVVDEEALQASFVLDSLEPLPPSGVALGPGLPIPTAVIRGAIKRFVEAYIGGDYRYQAGLAFLRRQVPSVAGLSPGQPLLVDGEPFVDASIRVAAGLSDSYLFIQGPPGAGKTYTGSHIIVELLRRGKRIGVTSNSHKAINNLLGAVERVAEQSGFAFRGAKRSTSGDSCLNGKYIEDVLDGERIIRRKDDYQLLAGTAWLFSSKRLDQHVDYLFVDEAGQVSLANLIAMSTCARNLVLLGDQMQLGQPIQGVHPGESGLSTLDYLLRGEATIAPHLGVFLRDTWRMHPDVCRFISRAVYDGRLHAEPKCAHQKLVLARGAHPAIRESGIAFVPVRHDACSQRSEEEAEAIAQIFDSLLAQRYRDRHGVEHPVTLSSILVVAPYNLQVNLLKRRLPEGARVGTVDKFQGQEAEVVLVSMTTSSGKYLPRHIEFLYSKNRLNVAISRARCFAAVVACPALLDVACQTPEQMALVNTLCWVRDYADSLAGQAGTNNDNAQDQAKRLLRRTDERP